MFYVAVFNNGQVSSPYSNRSVLESHNSYRLNDLHSVVQAESKEALDDVIKASLRTLKKSA